MHRRHLYLNKKQTKQRHKSSRNKLKKKNPKVYFSSPFLSKASFLKGQELWSLSGVKIHLSGSPWCLTHNPPHVFLPAAAGDAIWVSVCKPSSPDSCRPLGQNKSRWNSNLTLVPSPGNWWLLHKCSWMDKLDWAESWEWKQRPKGSPALVCQMHHSWPRPTPWAMSQCLWYGNSLLGFVL